jgi:hypothetical protein
VPAGFNGSMSYNTCSNFLTAVEDKKRVE